MAFIVLPSRGEWLNAAIFVAFAFDVSQDILIWRKMSFGIFSSAGTLERTNFIGLGLCRASLETLLGHCVYFRGALRPVLTD